MKNCCFKLILSVVFLLIMTDVHAQNVRVQVLCLIRKVR